MDQIEKAAETKTEKRSAKLFVDNLFDTVTAKTAKGLVLAKGALEGLARWLDARAKDAGELATRLSSPAPEQPRSAEPTTEPSV